MKPLHFLSTNYIFRIWNILITKSWKTNIARMYCGAVFKTMSYIQLFKSVVYYLNHWCLCCPLTAWQTVAFVPLMTSSHLTKIHITYTLVLQEGKIFPMILRSEWLGQLSLKCMKKLQDFNEKFKAKLPSATLGCSVIRISCLDDAFLKILDHHHHNNKVNRCSKR